MEEVNHILTYDIGSTKIKLTLFNSELNVMYEDSCAVKRYEDDLPYQRAEDWWEGVKELTENMLNNGVDGDKVGAVSSTGQMEDCLLVGQDNEPISKVLLYSDGRAENQFNHLIEKFGVDKMKAMTGNNFDPLMSVNKYLWLRDNEPEKFRSAEHLVMGSKDYLSLKLTGENVIDYTNASTTGFLDFRSNGINQELVEGLQLDLEKLPEIRKGTDIIGKLKPDVAEELGLEPQIPVLNGAGDLGASTLGSGAGVEGGVYGYLGTTGWLAKTDPNISKNENLFSLRNFDGDNYIVAGAILNAGSAYDWFLEKIMDLSEPNSEDYERVEEELKSLAPDKNSVPIFLPFLQGERSPLQIEEGQGGYFGLNSSTDKIGILKATLEGVAFSLRHNLIEILGENNQLKGANLEINLIGGGSESRVWPQMLSTILESKVNVLRMKSGAPSLGAAMIAGKGLGFVEEFTELDYKFGIKNSYTPKMENMSAYRDKFEDYIKLVETISGIEFIT